MAINVRGLANLITQNVNPNRIVTLQINDGYTVDDYGNQKSLFIEEEIEIQQQSLSSEEKMNLDLINRQGEFISIYAFGAIDGIRRWIQKGSSRFIFPAYGEDQPAVWDVEHVVESYANWTRVVAWRKS